MISTKNQKEVADKYPSVSFSSTRNIARSYLSLKPRICREKSVRDDLREFDIQMTVYRDVFL
jgi:hypothetical protein